jgi:tetratricopeptide (TPR) repeat protein
MLRVFLSSTFRDLTDERRLLLDNLNKAISDVGMEKFIPDGRTSHEISIEELRKSDIAIFLISPYYGSLIKECKIKNCNAVCPMKNNGNSISYTHCEYNIALSENKLHQTYIVNKDWDIITKLKNMDAINWEATHNDPILKNISSEELKHFFRISDLVSQFRSEAGKEMAQYITDISRITSDLANNIVKWYGDNKIDLMDYCGRRAVLRELVEKMDESVEVYGVGGIGKTSLVQLGLLIQKLKGKKIIAIGTRQSYLTGSGYKHFKDKCADEVYEILGEKVTLEDVAIALGIQKNLLGKESLEQINIIIDDIRKRNIALFIDDFHLSNDDIKLLVNKANCSIILASKRKIGLARNEIPLFGIEEEDRHRLIDIAAKRFHKEINSAAMEKIKNIAEGHPVSTEILVRNFELINFRELENFKKGLDISNPKHSEELLIREIKDILSDRALLLLKRLSVINPELESNINKNVIGVLLGSSSNSLLKELIDTGMLNKKKEHEDAYIFSYKHIQDIIREDKKDFHKWALNYYLNKPSTVLEGHADQIELLYHKSKIKPEKDLASGFFDLCRRTKPGQYGFKRLIDVGEQMESIFAKNKQLTAMILGNVANLYLNLNRYDKAQKAFRETLRIYRELSRQNHLAFRPHLATTLNNIAILYKGLQKFEDAEKAYLEALKIRRGLAERNADAFMPDVAMTLNNIAILYSDLQKFGS